MRAPCALGRRRRKIRALATTAVLVVFLVGTPLVVALAVQRVASGRSIVAPGDGSALGRADAVPLLLALVAILAWLPGAMATLGEVRRRNRPVRPSRLVPSSIRRVVARHVEASLLGAGTLRGWTSTRVDGALADLEVPARQAVTATVETHPDADEPRREDRVRRGLRGARKLAPQQRARPQPVGIHATDADRSTPVVAGPAAPRGPDAASSRWDPPTMAYVVQRGDTWWGLAERFLGDGRRFAELKELNTGRAQPDDTVVRHDAVLRAGWIIEVPVNGATV